MSLLVETTTGVQAFRSVARAMSVTVGMVIVAACACSGCVTHTGSTETCVLPLLDRETQQPLDHVAVVMLTESTPWHILRDPETTPFSEIGVVSVKALGKPELVVKKDPYDAWGIMPFYIVRHLVANDIVFSPGYHLSVRAPLHEKTAWREGKLSPLDKPEHAKDDTPEALYANNFFYVLGVTELWADLASRYRSGKDRQALVIICRTVQLVEERLEKDGLMADLTEAQASALQWCKSVSDNFRSEDSVGTSREGDP